MTSSNTTEFAEGSSPVMLGIGISNDFSCPVAELIFLLPIKKSPLLFSPVYTFEPPPLFCACAKYSSVSVRVLFCTCGKPVE